MPDKQHYSDPEGDDSNKGSSSEGENPLMDNQNYLETEQYVPFCAEWESLFHLDNMELNVPVETPFGIILKLKYAESIDPKDDLNQAKFFMGIKNPQLEYKPSIELGLYGGRLYISDIFDTVNLKKENLVEGIHIVLTVEPGLKMKSSATLTALSLKGDILSKIKTSKILNTAWNGKISTGAHFKSMRIEGYHFKY